MAFTKDDLRHFFRLGYDSGRTAVESDSLQDLFDWCYARWREAPKELSRKELVKELATLEQARPLTFADDDTPVPQCVQGLEAQKARLKARLKP